MWDMALAYDMVYGIAGVLSSPLWGAKLLKTGKWRTDWAARFGKCDLSVDPRPTLLIHGVSVGEVNAIRQLVKLLREQMGDRMRLIVSASTDTGLTRAKELFEPAITVVRYPLDFTSSVRRFLDAVQPDLVALVELEVWPNFIYECTKRHVPVCVVNGRLSARSFRGYRLGRAVLKSTFGRLAAAAVQTQDYADRFVALGAPPRNVRVTDSMKWDTAVIEDHVAGADALADCMGVDRNRPLVVAGSTGPGEEQMLLESIPADVQLMLVPRKPERFDEVAALDPAMVRRTQCPDGTSRPPGANRFLLDTMGELRKAYALAEAVLVGRSFLGLYGSDPLEPVALGKPTAIGPHYGDFQDIVDTLSAGGGLDITDKPADWVAETLQRRARTQAMGQRGRDVIRMRQGATERHAQLLLSLLPKSG